MKKITLVFISMLFSSMLQAQNFDLNFNPEMMIKYRKDFMTAVKGHNNSIKAIAYGAVPLGSHLNLHLSALQELFDEINSIFPEGSDFGDTNAKQSVWSKPDKFQQAIKDAQQALTTFKEVASQGDKAKTRAAFKVFGRSSCGSCHKSFKKKQN